MLLVIYENRIKPKINQSSCTTLYIQTNFMYNFDIYEKKKVLKDHKLHLFYSFV